LNRFVGKDIDLCMKGIVIICLLSFSLLVFAVNPESKVYTLAAQKTEQLIELEKGVISGSVSISEVHVRQLSDSENYLEINIPDFVSHEMEGAPDLPVYSRLVQIAAGVDYSLDIIELDSIEIELNTDFMGFQIAPKQPSRVRIHGTKEESIMLSPEFYSRDRYFSLPLATLNNEGVLRGIDLGSLVISPFKYNPIQNTLIIYYNIKIRLIPEGKVPGIKTELYSPVFDRALKHIVQNKEESKQKKVMADNPISMVILTDTIYREAIQPFVRWKTEKGYRVIEAYTSDPEVGYSRSGIKDYLSDLYTSPPVGISPPSYLLIIGETDVVPLSSSSGVTDLYYTTYDGPDDYLPEVFHGRISIKNEGELCTVLEKTMQYEKYQLMDPSYLDKSILIAGNDNLYAYSHGNGQINYASNYYFNDEHNVDAQVFLHPEASNSDLNIRELINEGAGFINYTGHGDEGGWIDPGFRTGHLSSFLENGKYGVIISNGCRTNVFSGSDDCFAEALLKADNKGVIGYIGCTADSYWDEDFYWSVGIGPISSNPTFENTTYGFYDKVFHDSIEVSDMWAPSLGEMIFAGNMSVQESNSDYREYYWKIYQVMGDPSLVPWFSVPMNPDVSYPSTLTPDAATVSIDASLNDYAAISVDGFLLDASHTDEFGHVELSIPEDYRGDTLLLVVTGDHRQPFIRQIPDAGYFELADISVMNESVVEDGLLSNGEEASFSISLLNKSIVKSSLGELYIEGMGKNMTILDNSTVLPEVDAEDTITLKNIFPFFVTDSLVDLSEVQFHVKRKSDRTYNSFRYSVHLHSPNLHVNSFSVSDFTSGNANGILEPGEEIQLALEIENTGSYKSDSVSLHISDEDTSFIKRQILVGMPLESGTRSSYSCSLTIPESYAHSGLKIIPLLLADGHFTHDTLYLITGKYFEDFSSDSLAGGLWKTMDWQRDTSVYYSAPAALKSGDIGHSDSSVFGTVVHVLEPDSIAFSYKVSSEKKYDFLKFVVDGIVVDRWSGEIEWSRFSYMLSTGIHELRWVYEKDINTDEGEDAAWVDNIIFVEDAFVPFDLSMDSIIVTRIGAFLNDEKLSVLVSNVGLDTIHDFSISFKLNEEEWNKFSFQDTILPDSSSIIILPGHIDFSGVGIYDLDVFIETDDDHFPWNDSLSTTIEHYAFPDVSIEGIGYDSSSIYYINLIALLKNSGNVPVEDIFYEVTIDEEFTHRGKVVAGLEPGDSTETEINLINEYYNWLETGIHHYRVDIEKDSVFSNNMIEGTVHWIATSDIEKIRGVLKLFPNPVGNEFVLQLDEKTDLPVRLDFLSMDGKLIHTLKMSTSEMHFYSEDIFKSAGIYLLHISGMDGKIYSSEKISVIRK